MEHADKIRLTCAAATGGAGCVVAIVMTLAGGDLARFLPQGVGFYAAAGVGAALAGLALADGFGRAGLRGAGLALLTAPFATALGAALAATLLTFAHSVAAMTGAEPLPSGLLTSAPVLGLLAVGDGISTSLPVAATWAATLTAVHLTLRRARLT